MKKYVNLLVAALFMLALVSCKKERHERNETRSDVLNVTIDAGVTYQLNLAQYGNSNARATISKQATNYQVSAVSALATGGSVYSFLRAGTPKTGGNGTEQVILKIIESEGRCSKEREVTINFTIN